MRARNRRDAIRDLYHERQVSLQCSPGGGQDAALIENAVHVPGWFKREELGFGFADGPSVEWTASRLREINTRNQAMLTESERPAALEPERRRRAKRTTALQYARRFHRALDRAGVKLRAA